MTLLLFACVKRTLACSDKKARVFDSILNNSLSIGDVTGHNVGCDWRGNDTVKNWNGVVGDRDPIFNRHTMCTGLNALNAIENNPMLVV